MAIVIHVLIPLYSRDDKRYTEKKNRSERARRKKEDNARLRNLVDTALAADPRIKRIKEEEKAARAAKKTAKAGGPSAAELKAKEEEEKRKAEEEAKLKEEQEKASHESCRASDMALTEPELGCPVADGSRGGEESQGGGCEREEEGEEARACYDRGSERRCRMRLGIGSSVHCLIDIGRCIVSLFLGFRDGG
jgi:hypothetical protein